MSNQFSDQDVLQYLKDHTYDETMEHFGISRMTISRVKKRNETVPKADRTPEKIPIAIVGVGNAASALVQGIEFYKERQNRTGILRPTLAGYHLADIEVVAAFDISKKKVNKSLVDALKENDFP